ncbi:MAG: hypothetical protein Q8M08_09670 [Bacteroidales bacterium]|nr:hypothetical protein [Bacteroidales bacterium]
MLRSKTLILFLIKALVIYGLLSAPLTIYDETYGTFYRKIAGFFFSNFRETGFVKFREWKAPVTTHINLGNYNQVRPDGTSKTAYVDINTRYLGYIPTVLLISLVIASPVPWKRKLIALPVGLILVMCLILFKQWIALLSLSEETPWLELTNFTGTRKTLLTFANRFISVTSSSVLYFVVAIWLFVTFRLDDFKPQTKGK